MDGLVLADREETSSSVVLENAKIAAAPRTPSASKSAGRSLASSKGMSKARVSASFSTSGAGAAAGGDSSSFNSRDPALGSRAGCPGVQDPARLGLGAEAPKVAAFAASLMPRAWASLVPVAPLAAAPTTARRAVRRRKGEAVAAEAPLQVNAAVG